MVCFRARRMLYFWINLEPDRIIELIDEKSLTVNLFKNNALNKLRFKFLANLEGKSFYC